MLKQSWFIAKVFTTVGALHYLSILTCLWRTSIRFNFTTIFTSQTYVVIREAFKKITGNSLVFYQRGVCLDDLKESSTHLERDSLLLIQISLGQSYRECWEVKRPEWICSYKWQWKGRRKRREFMGHHSDQ